MIKAKIDLSGCFESRLKLNDLPCKVQKTTL